MPEPGKASSKLIEIIISLCHYLFRRLYLGVNITDGVRDELNDMGMELKKVGIVGILLEAKKNTLRVRVQAVGY